MSIGLYIVLAPLYLKSVRKLQEKRFVFVKILAIIIPENGAKVSKIKCFQFAQQTLTSHDELVHEAFGRYVIGFVDKVKFYKQPDLLIEKLKIFKQLEEQKQTIVIKDELGSFCIYKDQIVKITSEHVYSYLEYTTGRMEKGRLITEKQLIRKTLKDWEKELGDNFLRPSKQMIINMDYIQRFDKIIILKDGTELSIPRTNYGKCHDRYFDYCGKKMKWK